MLNVRRKALSLAVAILIALGSFGLSACGQGGGGNEAEKTEVKPGEVVVISAEEAKEIIDDEDKNPIILDVRTMGEYVVGHIPGAVLLPNEYIESDPPEELPDKDALILIYCRSGNRSHQAAGKLMDMGYTQVYDFGGIIDWPYDTETGEPK